MRYVLSVLYTRTLCVLCMLVYVLCMLVNLCMCYVLCILHVLYA